MSERQGRRGWPALTEKVPSGPGPASPHLLARPACPGPASLRLILPPGAALRP